MAFGSWDMFGSWTANKPRVWRFTAAGIFVPPSWAHDSEPSSRTAEITASSLLTGVASNQAVCNRWGWQVEPSRTQYDYYLQGVYDTGTGKGWANAGTACATGPQADPSGGTSAGLMVSTANAQICYQGINLSAGNYTFSTWLKAGGSYSTLRAAVASAAYPAWISALLTPGADWGRHAVGVANAASPISGIGAVYGAYTAWGLPVSNQSGYVAFPQLENGLWLTSVIRNTSTTLGTLTRSASVLTCDFADRVNPMIDMTIVPAYAAGIAQSWLSDPLATGLSFGLNSSGNLVVIANGVTIGTGSAVLPPDTTNPYRIRAQFRGNSSAVDVRVDRYGQSPVVETITTSSSFAFASTSICVGSMGSVANTHVPCKGITRLEIR